MPTANRSWLQLRNYKQHRIKTGCIFARGPFELSQCAYCVQIFLAGLPVALNTCHVKIKIQLPKRNTWDKTMWQWADFHTSGRQCTPTFPCKYSTASFPRLRLTKAGVSTTTNFNPAWKHNSVFIGELLLYICFTALHQQWQYIAWKHERVGDTLQRAQALSVNHCTFFFYVSRMLVNLTLLKSTVKHSSKYDINPAQNRFMIFNFIYRDQGWAGHRVQFKTPMPHLTAERSHSLQIWLANTRGGRD